MTLITLVELMFPFFNARQHNSALNRRVVNKDGFGLVDFFHDLDELEMRPIELIVVKSDQLRNIAQLSSVRFNPQCKPAANRRLCDLQSASESLTVLSHL